MNIFFIGSVYPENLLKELIDLESYIDFPANNFQTALLNGLDESSHNIKVISSSPVTAFPKIKKWNFRKIIFSHKGEDKMKDVNVGVLNFPLISLLSRYRRILSELRRSIKKNENNVAIVYGLHTPFILSAWSMRKKLNKICVIVPDLPQFMSGKRNILYHILKTFDKKIINFCLKSVDSFILLSPYMIEKLSIDDKKISVIDGIFSETDIDLINVTKDKHKTILYTGNSFERLGIFDLIEAFKLIEDPDYRLWIRAFGPKVDEIIESIRDDNRIEYIPPMSRDDLLRLERKATILVNPVRPSQENTRYFFPSKTMEYLASATPTVMYHLDCLSEEYNSHIHYVPEETIESLRDTMVKVCEQSDEERNEFGKAAEAFILNYRNPRIQAAKILKLLEN